MVSEKPDARVLQWAARAVGVPAVEVVRGLRDGASPWLLSAGGREVVLRVGSTDGAGSLATEAAALRLADDLGVPAPALMAADDGTENGIPLVLCERLAGSSAIPPTRDPSRLRAMGAAAARLHVVPREPSEVLPLRDRPIGTVDFDQLRREQGVDGQLRAAQQRIAGYEPAGPDVLVHGDLWQGNVLWADGALTGFIDWDCAGAGPAGVDLGSLRSDAALSFGPGAADDVLAGWEAATGRAAADVAYWDVIAALATPPGMGWFVSAYAGQGRPDLHRSLLQERQSEFLDRALSKLPG